MVTNHDDNINQELSKNLIHQISNIIDGNQVTKNDLKPKDFETDYLVAHLYIEWTFFAEYKENSVAGGSYKGEAFNSVYELENKTKNLEKKAKFDKDLRASFVQNLHGYGREGILKSEGTHLINDFGKFSVKDICSTCNGSCKIRCNSCGGNGRQKCSYCYGSGSITQSRYNPNTRMNENYSTYCTSCGGSGNESCSSCSGTGKIRCGNCKGHGYFIITRHVVAKTKPVYLLRTNTTLANEELQCYLGKKSLGFLYKSIYFELDTQKASGDDKEMFVFKGKSIVLKQAFSVKTKEYTCYALSNPPHPFIRPAIFDDLFADELEFLSSSLGQKKHISKTKALKFFDTYSAQPVLDKAIKEVASVRKKSKEDTTALVIESCQGFISKDAASRLSNHINKFLDKVSPTYSPLVWYIGMLFITIISFVFFEYAVEKKGTENLLLLAFAFVAITLALSFILYILSLLITLLKRRRIPLEYRQKLRHIEIFKLYLKVSVFMLVLSFGYGVLSNKGHVPKTKGVPQKILINNVKTGYDFLEKKSRDIYKKTGLDEFITKLPILKDSINWKL